MNYSIAIKLGSSNTSIFKQGEGIVQGIFLPFGITEDDEVSDVRDGGFGSTDKK